MNWLLGLPLGLMKLLGSVVLVILRIAWPVLLGLGIAALARRVRRGQRGDAGDRQEPEKQPDFHGPVYTVDYEAVPDLSGVPDAPLAFGYKTAWLAVRCGDPAAVLEALGGRRARHANWRTGLAAALEWKDWGFLTPCLDGFVLAVGVPEEQAAALAARLTWRFDEVQAFATHRVSETHLWLRYRGGRLERAYRYDGASGTVREQGELTREEITLGFGALPRQGTCGERPPTEEDVLDIAAAWGVDPRRPGAGTPSVGQAFQWT